MQAGAKALPRYWSGSLRKRAPSARAVLAPYSRPGFWERHKIFGAAVLLFIALFYGLIFGALAPILIMQMILPLALLTVIVIWVMPDDSHPLERTTTALFTAYMISLMVWPDYLAVQLPGLPWITFARLFAIPMTLVYLISLSQSRTYRQEIGHVLSTTGPLWRLLAAFSVLALISIGFSSQPMASLNKYIVYLYSGLVVFLVACHLFLRPGKVFWITRAFWLGAIVACIVGVLENRAGKVLWAGHIPSIFKIDDPIIETILAAKVRAATGLYRLKGKFTTPLGLSEFLALCSPFILHATVQTRRTMVRLSGVALLAAMTWVIIKTDARLGFIGLLLTFILYSFYFSYRRWQQNRSSLIMPLVLLSYPAAVVAFFISSFFVRRIHNMIWGHGAYSASTEGRIEQIEQGIPMILNRPWGYGIGRAAETLGFTNELGTLTIDSFYLSIALEVGIVGFILYYGAFLVAIWQGTKALLPEGGSKETELLAPAVIMLVEFVIIKAVFSQQENHPLFFAGLGMAVALTYRRIRELKGASKTTQESAPLAGTAAPATA